MGLEIIILAAGKGKRMNSNLPKALSLLAGKPLLQHVIDTCRQLGASNIHIVYGHCGDHLRSEITEIHLDWVKQEELLGTGHATQQALKNIAATSQVLVLAGDVPLISVETLKNLIANTPTNGIGILTADFPNPFGYGRILRDEKHNIQGIVEERDATDQQRQIKEINTGIICSWGDKLNQWLQQVRPQNAQGEYYLTDVVTFAVKDNAPVIGVKTQNHEQVLGVNSREQLAELERCHQRQLVKKLMQDGATVLDPNRVDIRGEVTVGKDVIIDINVILIGKVNIGNNSVIGPNVVITDSAIGENVTIKPNCVIEETKVADNCIIGPFARLRPGTELSKAVHIGNFVELKKTTVDEGSKINHLSYIGDCIVGANVNIGAGTITCNYDGVNKNRTIIGNEAFIGSGTELVAPVTLGAGAYIGAGSTITEDAPAGKLTLARARQTTIEGWQSQSHQSRKKD